jgi:hypothetical protein
MVRCVALAQQGDVPTAQVMESGDLRHLWRKLPDPAGTGQRGRFLQNHWYPLVAQRLRNEYTDLVAYQMRVDGRAGGQVKLAAGTAY